MVDINEKQEPEYVNSFTAVWLKTRKAVRYTIEEKTTGYAMILVLLSGIGGSLVGMQGSGNGEILAGWLILLLALTVGPLAGLASAAIMSGVYLVVGKIFKGNASYVDMFKAVAVAMIPNIWVAPIVLVWAVSTPETYFADPFADTINNGGFATFIILSALFAILSIWCTVIQSKAIGEAHQFSAWKGFATLVIPAVLMAVIAIVVVIIFFMLIASSSF